LVSQLAQLPVRLGDAGVERLVPSPTPNDVKNMFGIKHAAMVPVLLDDAMFSEALKHRLMGHGRIVHEGPPASLGADSAVRKEWLEV